MVEKGIVALLLADSNVAALVGTRVYPAITRQTQERPNVVYQRLTTNRISTQDGPTGSADCLLQLSCWADTYKAARTLAEKVRLALDGYAGTSASVVIDGIFVQDEQDMPTPPDSGDEVGVYGVRLDFRVHFQESF